MTPSDTRTRFPIVATCLTLLAIVILCGLGTWQVQRLHWKQDMLERIHSATPLDLTALSATDKEPNGHAFRRISVSGTYMTDHVIMVGPRTWQSKAGYHLYMPLRLANGKIIIVRRGWIENKNEKYSSSKGRASRVTGVLIPPERPSLFMPVNQPDKNIWFFIDLTQIAEILRANSQDLYPYIVYAENETAEIQKDLIPIGFQEPNNHHLYYAIFWYTMALILCVIFSVRFIFKK